MKRNIQSALLLISLLNSAIGLAATASAHRVIDCPLRDEHYSIDSPLIDVLLKPEAKAAVDRKAPDLLQHFPPMFASTRARIQFHNHLTPGEISAAIRDFVMDGINANSHLGDHPEETS